MFKVEIYTFLVWVLKITGEDGKIGLNGEKYHDQMAEQTQWTEWPNSVPVSFKLVFKGIQHLLECTTDYLQYIPINFLEFPSLLVLLHSKNRRNIH